MSNSISIVKNQAKLLKTRLSALGVKISHANALEGVAAVRGHKDWNTFLSILDSQEKISQRKVSDESESNQFANIIKAALQSDPDRVGDGSTSKGGYIDLPISLYENDCTFTHLALAPGFGKTKIIKDLCDQAIERNQNAIVISFYPTGSSFKEISDSNEGENFHLTTINNDHVTGNAVSGLSITKKSPDAKVQFYIVEGNVSGHGRNYFERQEILDKLVDIVYQNNSTDSLNSLKYIIVDGIEALKIVSRHAMEKSLAPLVRGDTKVVIASQVCSEDYQFDSEYQHTFSAITNSQTSRFNKNGEGFRYIIDDKTSISVAVKLLFERGIAKDIASYLKMRLCQSNAMKCEPKLLIDYAYSTLDIVIDYLVANRDVKGQSFGIAEIKNCLAMEMHGAILKDDLVDPKLRLNLVDILKQFPRMHMDQLSGGKVLPGVEDLYDCAMKPIYEMLARIEHKSGYLGSNSIIAKTAIKISREIDTALKNIKQREMPILGSL